MDLDDEAIFVSVSEEVGGGCWEEMWWPSRRSEVGSEQNSSEFNRAQTRPIPFWSRDHFGHR